MDERCHREKPMTGATGKKIDIGQVFLHFRNRPLILAMIVLASAFTNFVVSFDVNLYFFSSPFIVQGISLPDIYLGISASSFTLGVIIFASLGGIIFDRYSIKWFLVLSITISTIFSVLTGYASSAAELVFYRFMFGVGNGLVQGLITSLLGGLNPSRKGFLLSLKGITFSAGLLLGPYAESFFAPSYHITYLITGIIGVAGVLLLIIYLPDVRSEHGDRRDFRFSRLFNRNTTLTFMSIFFFGIGLFGFLGYFSHYMLSFLRIGTGTAALVSAMLGVGGLILTLPLGHISDVWSRKGTLIAIFLMLALSTAGMFLFPVGALVLMLLSLVFGGAYNSLINVVSAASQEWAGKEVIGKASGATFSFYYGGGIIGGVLFGSLISIVGFRLAGFYAVTIFMVLGLACSILIKPGLSMDTTAGLS